MTRRLTFWSGLIVALLWVGTSWAEPSAADRATARALAGEGYQALQEKDYATAADRFSRADALVHAPTLMIDWARSLAGLGKLVEAQERYEQIVREGVEPKAPKSWHRALADAGAELAQLKPRLAWVTISVSGAAQPEVTIDGAPVPAAAIGVRRAVNPGSLQVQAQAKDFLSQTKTVELREGAEESVDFQLEPDPNARVAAAVKPPPAPPPAPAEHHNRAPMYVAFGVSAAGFVVGAVTGGLFLSKRAELDGVCTADGACESKHTDLKKQYDTLGIVSPIGFAVGVAGAGTGLALWLLNRDGAGSSSQGVSVHPYVGLGNVGAVGSF